MKLYQAFFLCFLFTLSACGFNEREQQLKQKENDLNQKEQKLVLWEQQLTLKEQALADLEHRLDSTKKEIDSVVVPRPAISGKWQVKMQCIETSCDGSAIGDVLTENWEFQTGENSIVVHAYTGTKLTRIYNGSYTTDGIVLQSQNNQHQTTMNVTLNLLKDGKMEGLREINMPQCKTSYSISAKRL